MPLMKIARAVLMLFSFIWRAFHGMPIIDAISFSTFIIFAISLFSRVIRARGTFSSTVERQQRPCAADARCAQDA